MFSNPLIFQGLSAGLAAAAAGWLAGPGAAAAAAYGGGVALAGGAQSAWRARRGRVDADPHRQLRGLVAAAAEHVVLTAGLLGLGLGFLGLAPLALLGGFFIGHLGWVAGNLFRARADATHGGRDHHLR